MNILMDYGTADLGVTKLPLSELPGVLKNSSTTRAT